MLGLRAVLGYAGPVQDTAAGNGIAQWWDEIDGSLEWQRRLFYALCAAYSLVALVALVHVLFGPKFLGWRESCQKSTLHYFASDKLLNEFMVQLAERVDGYREGPLYELLTPLSKVMEKALRRKDQFVTY